MPVEGASLGRFFRERILERIAETQFFRIGKEIFKVTRTDFILCCFPELCIQKIAVVFEKSCAHFGRPEQEGGKFLGENIVLSH